jgi:hypothetical protein
MQAEPNMYVEEKAYLTAIGLIGSRVDAGLCFDARWLQENTRRLQELDDRWQKQRHEVVRWGTDPADDVPFPSQPRIDDPVLIS